MLNYKTATKEQLKDEYKRLAHIVSSMTFGTKKEFFHLPQILGDNEQPLAVASGMMDGNTWLITLTNQRVIFLDKGMLFGVKQIDVNLRDIISVGGKTGILMGEILVGTHGKNYTIKDVSKDCVIPFTNLINSTRNLPNENTKQADKNKSSSDDLISQIERLAALKEKGILSEEEFQQQKSKLLNA
ncbi:PH domain-containing protein [Pectobacterium versatile]|uniref:PH domain-containing protein n=1 Tax=Pectobacterium versatile TaxID=2488639 RepID=UPI001F38E20A|nr:PH domain-containing protein [Pectobacterium versatile]